MKLAGQGKDTNWQYPADPMKAEYPGGTYKIKTQDRNEVIFFSTLTDAINGANLPHHLWHMISVPRWIKNATGLYPDAQMIDWEQADKQYNAGIARLVKQSSVPDPDANNNNHVLFAYNVVGRAQQGTRANVTTAWRTLLKSNAPLGVVFTAENDRTSGKLPLYYHSFHFIESSKVTRFVSTRGISDEGVVYGFVLDDMGNCLAAASVKVVR